MADNRTTAEIVADTVTANWNVPIAETSERVATALAAAGRLVTPEHDGSAGNGYWDSGWDA